MCIRDRADGAEADGSATDAPSAEAAPARLELWSLDRQPGWFRYVHALGYFFAQWDFDLDEPPRAACDAALDAGTAAGGAAAAPPAPSAEDDGGFDWIILSNVLMYCDNDQAADRLAALLMPAPAPGGGAGRAPRCLSLIHI